MADPYGQQVPQSRIAVLSGPGLVLYRLTTGHLAGLEDAGSVIACFDAECLYGEAHYHKVKNLE